MQLVKDSNIKFGDSNFQGASLSKNKKIKNKLFKGNKANKKNNKIGCKKMKTTN